MFRFAAVLCFCVLSSACVAISDEEKEEFKKLIEPVAKACMEEIGIEAEDLKEMKKKNDIDPCFMACILKASGSINSDGKFDYQPSLDIAKEVIKDENVLDKMREAGENCMKVNDENVKDACGRAKLLMECFQDQKDIHGLEQQI